VWPPAAQQTDRLREGPRLSAHDHYADRWVHPPVCDTGDVLRRAGGSGDGASSNSHSSHRCGASPDCAGLDVMWQGRRSANQAGWLRSIKGVDDTPPAITIRMGPWLEQME